MISEFLRGVPKDNYKSNLAFHKSYYCYKKLKQLSGYKYLTMAAFEDFYMNNNASDFGGIEEYEELVEDLQFEYPMNNKPI
jgi:hypothetical protein